MTFVYNKYMNVVSSVYRAIEQEYSTRIHYGKLIGALIAIVYIVYAIQTPQEFHIISTVNLIFHEAGHTLAAFFGKFIHFLAGSAMQVIVPLVIAGYFFLKREFYSSGIIIMWMGQSLVEVSVYMGDAQRMVLPLLGGDSVEHDWNTLFSMLGILEYTDQIAGITYFAALMIVLVGIGLTLWCSRSENVNK